jgi:putative transcriptional regulator
VVQNMIVKNRLAILMAEKEIRSISELQRMLEEIGYPIARKTLDRFYKNENNQIHYDTIVAICSVLNCSIGELFTLAKE